VKFLTVFLLVLPLATRAAEHAWTVAVQGGIVNDFQLSLGSCYGHGPYFQDRLTGTISDAFRKGDAVTLFGWSTSELRKSRINWMSGLSYKTRVWVKDSHSLHLSGGVQHWNLPSIKGHATSHSLIAGNLSYAGKVGRVPLFVTQDSYSLTSSTLPVGSLLYTQIQTQSRLLKRDWIEIAVRHGVHHGYSWGFWGANGNRVVRYGASLLVTWKANTFEGGVRQQFGLQDRIPYNRLWTFQVTRQIGGRFGRRG